MLTCKNISSTSNEIKRKYSNTYLYFENYCNTMNKPCGLVLDVAGCVYLDISNTLKPTSDTQ